MNISSFGNTIEWRKISQKTLGSMKALQKISNGADNEENSNKSEKNRSK